MYCRRDEGGGIECAIAGGVALSLHSGQRSGVKFSCCMVKGVVPQAMGRYKGLIVVNA